VAVKRDRRIIDALRARYPGTWAYDAECYCWRREDGFEVHGESHAYSRGDDARFVAKYVRSDTGEDLYWLPGYGRIYEP
jgi:hypothetical protein